MRRTETPVLWQCDYRRQRGLEKDVARLGQAYFEVLFRVLSRPEGPPPDLWASPWVMLVMCVPELLDHFLDALKDVEAYWHPPSREQYPDQTSTQCGSIAAYYGLSFEIYERGIYMHRYSRHGPFCGWQTKSVHRFQLHKPGSVYRRPDGRLCHYMDESWYAESRLLDHEDPCADLQQYLLRACCTRLSVGGHDVTWVGHHRAECQDGHRQYLLPYLAQICNIRARELINDAM